jgi:hypothetical protein
MTIFSPKKVHFHISILFILRVVRHETTTIGKLAPSTFRLYSIYTYDGPTLDPEIALEEDHAKK